MRRSRWSACFRFGRLWPVVALLAGCGDFGDGGEFIDEPPPPDGPPTGPTDPPTTGSKWQGTLVEDDCGRVKLAYVLIDEVCGGTEDPFYMDYFHAPIMRDGVLIDDRLFAVDATNLWVLDMTDADEPKREALLAGFGQPMSVATHAGRLLIAGGDEGLLLVDVTDPASPFRLSDVAFDGPALDVWIEGDTAFVATGASGVAVVDILESELSLRTVLPVPGFAAAVASRSGTAYVAACDTFATIDVATGALLGHRWIDNAYQDDILVAPAKDVSLAGDVAFVAAGRYGAVAMDVTDPTQVAPIGNCTLTDDQSFYASGVRDFGGTLYVAGGEYGILPLDVSNPATTCSTLATPGLPAPPEDDLSCSTEPPWELVPWAETWVPPSVPPEGRDPLQTLPVDGRVFAFGDATRIGIRAIDVRNPANLDEKLGRYAEPRLTEGIAVQGDAVLVAGKGGGLFGVGEDGVLAKTADVPEAKLARAAAFLGDGRWVLGGLSPQTGLGVVYVEGAPNPIDFGTQIWSGGLAAKAATFYVPTEHGVIAYDTDSSFVEFSSGREAHLPQSVAVGEDHLLVASPEWTSSLEIDGVGATPLAAIGAFGDQEIASVSRWRKALPRRVVMTGDVGDVEVASLGGEAGVTLHGEGGPVSAELPPGDYVAATLAGSRVYAVAVDRGRYRTQLVTIDLFSGAPQVMSVVAFSGAASGVAASAERLFVADGDRGIRVFDVASPTPTLVQVLDLSAEAQP
ncbi:MAG: hypothetical protein HOW73_00905 [Polyangiaceae bacterium]|nr:hypothetical protein [Polyangiaceae bacterium]